MMYGIPMSKVKLAVMEAQVERLLEKQKELTERVRSNEKVIAGASLLGVIAITIIGAGYFAPKAEAAIPGGTAGGWIERFREWKSRQTRTSPEESLNSALIMHEEDSYGCDDTTESEELLQLQSNEDQQGDRRGHDRRDSRSWFQPIEEGESKDCRGGHTREEDEELRRKSPWSGRDKLVEGEVDGDY